MSTAAAVRTRRNVLSDYVLSEPSYLAHADIEEEMNRRLESRYIDVHTRHNPERFEDALKEAAALIRARPFKPYTAEYLRALILDAKLVPYLTLACLERHHPTITLNTVRTFLSDDATFHRVREAVLDLFEAGAPKKDEASELATASAQAST